MSTINALSTPSTLPSPNVAPIEGAAFLALLNAPEVTQQLVQEAATNPEAAQRLVTLIKQGAPIAAGAFKVTALTGIFLNAMAQGGSNGDIALIALRAAEAIAEANPGFALTRNQYGIVSGVNFYGTEVYEINASEGLKPLISLERLASFANTGSSAVPAPRLGGVGNTPEQPVPTSTPAPAPDEFYPRYDEAIPFDFLESLQNITVEPSTAGGEFSPASGTWPFGNAPSYVPTIPQREWTPIDEDFPDPANANGPRWEDAPADAAELAERLLNGGQPTNTDPVEWNRNIDRLTRRAVTSVSGPGPSDRPENTPSGGFPGGAGMGYGNEETPEQERIRTAGNVRERLEEMGLNDTSKSVHDLATDFVRRLMNGSTLDENLPQARRVLEAIANLPDYYHPQLPVADRLTTDAELRRIQRNATGVASLQPGQSTDIINPDGSIAASVLRKQNGYAVYSNADDVVVKYPNSTHHVGNGAVRDARAGGVLEGPGFSPILLDDTPPPAPNVIVSQPGSNMTLPSLNANDYRDPIQATTTGAGTASTDPATTPADSADQATQQPTTPPASTPSPTVMGPPPQSVVDDIQAAAARRDAAMLKIKIKLQSSAFNSNDDTARHVANEVADIIRELPVNERSTVERLTRDLADSILKDKLGNFTAPFNLEDLFKSLKGPDGKSSIDSGIITGSQGSDIVVGGGGMSAEEARKAEESRQIAQATQAIKTALTLLGPTVPPAVRSIVGNGLDAINVAHNPSALGVAGVALNILKAFEIDGAVGDAVEVAAFAAQAAQMVKAGSVTGGIQLGVDLGLRFADADPKVRALAGMAMNIGRLMTGDLTAFAQLPWSVVGINQAFTTPRVDMGEQTVADGLLANVDFVGRSAGPEYHYVLAAGQANLPEMVGASFRLLENDDGSFRVSGFGSRGPFSSAMDTLGHMTTPNWVEDGWISRNGPDGQPLFQVSAEVGRQWLAMQGGNPKFDIDRSFPGFSIVERLFEAADLETIYRRDANDGFLTNVDAGLGGFDLIQYPHGFSQVQGYDDRVVAQYDIPGMMHRFTFRDTDNAALFQAYGMNILSLIASDPDLINAYGSRHDIQGMIDFVLGNPDRTAPADPFDTFAYAAANPDLRQHFDERDMMGYALHYLTAGHFEGRPRHADLAATAREIDRYLAFAAFDENVYRALYPDVAAAIQAGGFADAREHFRAFGMNEGRMPAFNEQAYLAANPDVAAAVAAGGGTALDHYVQFGQHEGRMLTPPAIEPGAIQPAGGEPAGGFNEHAYLAANPDVAAAIANGTMDSASGHWERHGQAEGRGFFDEQAYLAANQDVAAAIANGTMDSAAGHWERHGQSEGREMSIAPVAQHVPVPEPTPPQPLDEAAYLAARPDVAEAIANGTMDSVQGHWERHGQYGE